MRCATIFVSLLRIPGLFTGHISGIEMVLAFGILAGCFSFGFLLFAIGPVTPWKE
jgi:hypothetical protein